MSGKPAGDEANDDRLELRRMLSEIEAEAKETAPGIVKQSEILEMLKNRKKRDPDG